MRTPSGPAPTLPALARPRLTIPTLTIPANVTLPLRQDVPIPDLPWPRVTAAIRATLASAGFEILAIREDVGPAGTAPSTGYPRRSETLAERRRRSVSMPAPVRVSVYVLFGAGLGLGIFDAVAVGVALVALAWAGGGAVVAALFWLRYGRSFQSEVAVVVLRSGQPATDSARADDANARHIAWFAGGVRSDVRGSHRTAVEVAVPPGLARDAGGLARDFEQRLLLASASPEPRQA